MQILVKSLKKPSEPGPLCQLPVLEASSRATTLHTGLSWLLSRVPPPCTSRQSPAAQAWVLWRPAGEEAWVRVTQEQEKVHCHPQATLFAAL